MKNIARDLSEQADIFMESDRFITEVRLKSPIPEGSYLKKLPAVRFLERHPLEFRKRVSIFAGENGSGKSTLLEGIATAYGFNPEGGSLNYSFETNATHSELYRHLLLSKLFRPKDGFFLRAESFYNAASYLERLDEIPCAAPPILKSYGGISLHKMSHGESFLKLVQSRFSGSGLYILDEPEAALSPMNILTLICEIKRLADSGSQFIIATHSPMLMALPDAELLYICEGEIKNVPFRETPHWQIMLGFLKNPERILSQLLQ